MKIDVKLEVFEGPLDLLLHLIEKNKVSIYDIPIVEITSQYIDYIKDLERVASMDVMSEFLVMAATLLRIKSLMLLPHEEKEEEEDPREELVRRLMEYKMYKYAASELKDLRVDADKVYFRQESLPSEIRDYEEPVDPKEIVGDTSLLALSETFRMVMKRKRFRRDPVRSRYGKIKRDEYKVEERMENIRSLLIRGQRMNFRILLESRPSREKVIVTFLAVLELVKGGEVTVEQTENFDEIYIRSKEDQRGEDG